MAIPLIVLAIGSVVAGYVGVPHALGGSNRIERSSSPASRSATRGLDDARRASAVRRARAVAPGGEPARRSARRAATELMLMALSSGVAVAGIGIARVLLAEQPRGGRRGGARSFARPHRLLSNKYYVDEVYDAAIVQPIKLLSTGGLWKGVDAGLIDGAVNGVGPSVRGGEQRRCGGCRPARSATYAASLFLGVVLILGCTTLWR